MNTIQIGTRASKLALAQADYISSLITKANSEIKIEIVKISTKGDKDKTSALEQIGGTGVFTKRIENELLNGNIDIAVHSAKDLPSRMTEGLIIGAVPSRGCVEDALISKDKTKLDKLRQGAVVGTGSPRRRAMLLHYRNDLVVEQVRGNVETRLKKLDDNLYDALVMAHAGLSRIELEKKVTEILPTDKFIPAPGQGALVVQIKEDDDRLKLILEKIDDPDSFRCLRAERFLLLRLNAGCSAAVGGLALIEEDKLHLAAAVLSKNGEKRIDEFGESDNIIDDENMVNSIVEKLFSQGAKELID